MKANTISIEADGFKIKGTPERFAQLVLASVITAALPPAPNVQPVTPANVPALGEYWTGQGGINGGLIAARGDVPAHYLIFAKDDVGEHTWGRYREEAAATSRWDGKANTDALIAAGGHPAAEACRAYTADGHTDFDLPAAAQLYQAWAHDLITEGYYWSSSQRSAYGAFTMIFDGGSQGSYGKGNELRVRPVRRFFI